ncbi:MAG TPA: LuxR C-terminal-related transcriptional regulator [Mesorhizobium sp.]|nr:LuxR C-terminal-related transcriptional regulator [Mesorhizobium sp.]
MRMAENWQTLANAIQATGTGEHLDRMIDLICSLVPYDLITVTRYSATEKPEFVKHRRFSEEMVAKYLRDYYVYDPFYAHWRKQRRAGVLPLRKLASPEMKRGQYIAEFLAQSRICDELGVLMQDAGDRCLGIFLDRSEKPFRDSEVQALEQRFPVFASLHARDVLSRSPPLDSGGGKAEGASPQSEPQIPETLWPELSGREKQVVKMILAGHPTATVAKRLGITVGTAKNHRRRIYEKLDITTERELFLQFFHSRSG